jgi:hypothetical protein
VLAMGLVTAGVLAWLVPVAIGSGGFSAWSERTLALLPSTDPSSAAFVRQLAANTAISFGTLAFSIGPALVLALVCNWRKAWGWLRSTSGSPGGVFWLIWIAPAFVFLWLVDSTEPGHDLIFAGALCALGAAAVVQSVRERSRLAVAGGALVATQALVFLYAAPVLDRPLAWTADAMLLNVTAPGLRQQQASLSAALRTIRGEFNPADTLVVTVTDQDPYRFMMYYLPEYEVIRLDPHAQRVMTARDRKQGNWQSESGCLFDAAGVRHAVWVLSAGSETGLVPSGARLDSSVDGAAFQVWVEPAHADSLDYLGFAVIGSCGALSASSSPADAPAT